MSDSTDEKAYRAWFPLAFGTLWLVASVVGLGLMFHSRLNTPFVGLVLDKYSKKHKGWKVGEVMEGSPAEEAGVLRGWVLTGVGPLRLDELAMVRHPDHVSSATRLQVWREWQNRIRATVGHGRATEFSFNVPGTGATHRTIRPTSTPGWVVARHTWLLVLVGVIYAGVGLLTVFLRPTSMPARKLLWWCLFVQAFHFVTTATEFPRLLVIPWLGGAYFWAIQDVLFFVSGAAILDFCLTFLAIEWRTKTLLVAVLHTASLGLALAYNVRMVHMEAVILPLALYLACMVLLVIRYRRSRTALVQSKQIKWLLWGAAVPVFSLVSLNLLLYTVKLHTYRDALISVNSVCTLAFPAATALAILRLRLFDIDVVVRRSLVAAVAVALLLAVYVRVAESVGAVLAPGSLPAFLLVAVVVLIVLLPGQLRVEETIDRLLGLNRYTGRTALGEMAANLAKAESLTDVARRVVDGTCQALELQNAALYLVDSQQTRMALAASSGTFESQPAELPPSVLEQVGDRGPRSVFPEDFARWNLPATALGLPEPVVVLPVQTSTRALGLLAVGRRTGRRSLSGDEIRALENLAGAVAMAADRALHQELLHKVQSMQAQIIHAGRMAALGTLAAGVAHELNTPLGYVSANAQLIEKKLAEAAKEGPVREATTVLDLARDIREGADQMAEVVRNLRSFVRLDHQGHEPVDANQCVQQSLRLMANSIPQDVTVDCQLQPVPAFSGHPAQINQVIVNLVSNASQAMDGKGRITVRTWAENDKVFLQVLDDGPGLPPERLDKAFDPFFTTRPVGKGMGLGLTISRTVVEAHNGRLDLANRTDGARGAAATVVLPVKGTTGEENP